MAMHLNHVDHDTVHKMEHWSSDTFLLSCTSTSRSQHFFLAYPRRCLLKSDGTSNIEGPTVVDEPAAAAAAAA
jgi:hypothetical protein